MSSHGTISSPEPEVRMHALNFTFVRRSRRRFACGGFAAGVVAGSTTATEADIFSVDADAGATGNRISVWPVADATFTADGALRMGVAVGVLAGRSCSSLRVAIFQTVDKLHCEQ